MKKAISLLAAMLLTGAVSLFAATPDGAKVVYTDASTLPIHGKCVPDTYSTFSRLPADLQGVSRDPVWYLGRNSAGLYVRFRTDAPAVYARWTSTFKNSMNHMTDTGTRGLDLYYLKQNGQWEFAGAGRPNQANAVTETVLVGNVEPMMREYMLYLSLYDGVSNLEIGVPEGYEVLAPEVNLPASDKPVVMYGTSILQGGCASRPGMAHTAIIGRRLNREVINLGFSGNGQLDYEIAELMAKVPDPAVYVMDNVPNCSVEQIEQKTEHFVEILRNAHPDVPIIFIEDPQFSQMNLDQRMRHEVTTKNAAQWKVYNKMKDAGMQNIAYIQSKALVGWDTEAFVDGIHFTDLGMTRYADRVTPVIASMINPKVETSETVHDWAWSYRFQKDNSAVNFKPKAVFMGDSITEGWASADPEFFSSHKFLGRGISGQVSTQMLARFHQDVVAFKPKYVVILCGTNDIAQNQGPMTIQNTVDNIASMCDIAKKNGIKPIICTITPCDHFYWKPEAGDPSAKVVEWNEQIRAYAAQNKIKLVDFHSALKAEGSNAPAEGMTYDHCHLTLDAYKIIEEMVLKVLK